MAPTFRGADDDWLDDRQPPARAKAAKKPVESRALVLRPDEANGTVTELFPNQSAVRLDGTKNSTLCGYRMSTLAFGIAHRERSPVCVGDRVRVERGVIVGRCQRHNQLIRPAPNARDPLLHALAANLDLVVVVASAREPDFTPGIVDRFLVAASAQKIPSLLCVNKIDLIETKAQQPWSHYATAGVPLIETCAKNGRGTAEIAAQLAGKAAAFCGHSGVGKTSLLRHLLKDESYGRVGAVSNSTGQGRHTTTGAVLLAGPEGSTFIDTPGIMNFGLLDVTRAGLLSHFPELQIAAGRCPGDCAHDQEPGCTLRELPRHQSYRQILSCLPS